MNLIDVSGVGDKTLSKLNDLGIFTVENLIEFMPNSYIDMTKEMSFQDVIVGEYALLRVKINSVTKPMHRDGKVSYVRAVGSCDGFDISFIWFNMSYVSNVLTNDEWLIYGQVSMDKGRYSMINPSYDKPGSKKMSGICPIYPLRGKISNSTFNKIVCASLKTHVCENHLNKVFNIQLAYNNVHNPKTIKDMRTGQYNLCMYQLVRDLLAYRISRVGMLENTVRTYELPTDIENTLPYKLSVSQKQTLEDIHADMTGAKCMNRLVLGDVGSGKTIVAILAMGMVSKCSSGQSVMMAPTEILCRQHYENAKKLLADHDLSVGILTASTNAVERAETLKNLLLGKINILFATHSCINESVLFDNLKLIVIDELHKFGVEQRAKLLLKGRSVGALSLSATPVPRTLAMCLYGDLAVSNLYKRDDAVSNIKTYVFHSNKLYDMYGYIASKVAKGSKCFVVCPRLKGIDKTDVLSCFNMYDLLKKDYVKSDNIALVYGSQKADEKSAAMAKFSSGQVQVLVSTTVIEVGIDIQEADTIFIIGSDYHGLATLHQLRGRVGRDGRPSECFMHVRTVSTPERIESMKTCSDGVRLAEIDAKARGYGDMIGTRQSGVNIYNKYKVIVSIDMIKTAKGIADSIDIDSVDAIAMTKDIIRANKTVLN